MSKRVFFDIVCIVLSISLVLINCSAYTLDSDEDFYFSKLEFKHLESNTTEHSLTGYITSMSDTEFLNTVSLIYNYNLDFLDKFTIVPYSIQQVEFRDFEYEVECLVPCMKSGDLTPKVTGQYSLNGRPYSLTAGAPINWYSGNMPFEYLFTVANVYASANLGPYNYILGGKYKEFSDGTRMGRILTYQYGNESSSLDIIGSLDSITSSLSSISSNVISANSLLSNIYSSISNNNNNLSAIASTLSSIDSKVSTIVSTANSILSAVNVTNNVLDDTYQLLDESFTTLDNDLVSIDYNLGIFSSNFSSYASSVLNILNSIDGTTQHIDETLDQMMEHFNGTALEGVTVEGSNSPNLWQLIKSSVSTGLSGLGQYFALLFKSITEFASQAVLAFGYFGGSSDISNYSPVQYNPTDLTIPPDSNIFAEPVQLNINNSKYVIKGSGNSYNIESLGNDTTTGFWAIIPKNSVTLTAGNYILYRFSDNSNAYVTIFNSSGGARIKQSPTTTSSIGFTLSSDTSILVNLYVNGTKTFTTTGTLRLEKVS